MVWGGFLTLLHTKTAKEMKKYVGMWTCGEIRVMLYILDVGKCFVSM